MAEKLEHFGSRCILPEQEEPTPLCVTCDTEITDTNPVQECYVCKTEGCSECLKYHKVHEEWLCKAEDNPDCEEELKEKEL